jgi:hypothetical protein
VTKAVGLKRLEPNFIDRPVIGQAVGPPWFSSLQPVNASCPSLSPSLSSLRMSMQGAEIWDGEIRIRFASFAFIEHMS